MTTEVLDPIIVSKQILQQIEQVTCIECCQYYIAPETAPCGHSLCHSCWSGRRSCPTCEASVNRKSLKLNLPLRTLTDHARILGEAFEKLFNVKLEEFTLDIPEMQLQCDPTKNVKDWLACSENHFSAPVSSQQSHGIVESMELNNSKIQIHTVQQKKDSTETEIKNSSKKVVSQKHQEDWDKIEILTDTEDVCTKDKENIVGPMDIEPFYFEENEYTNDHPRRSSRKKELKNDSSYKSLKTSVDMQSSRNSGNESKKVKQNWSNVKKMTKEFRKLNRNKRKLNVSIEMFKKSQSSAKKPKEATREPSPKPCYDIDDNTPNIKADNNKVDSLFSVKTSMHKDKESYFALQKTNFNEVNSKCATIDVSRGNSKLCIEKKESDHVQEKRSHLQNENNSVDDKNRSHHSHHNISNDKVVNVIKKSSLLHESTQDNCSNTFQNNVNLNNVTGDSSDDIEISIKIGSTVTKIVIKKNQNDVQLQINRDREVQTSLGPFSMNSRRDIACSPLQVGDIQNDDENKIVKLQIQPSVSKEKIGYKIDNIQNEPISKNNEPLTDVIPVQSSRLNEKTDDKVCLAGSCSNKIEKLQIQPSVSKEKIDYKIDNIQNEPISKNNEPLSDVIPVQSSRLNEKTDDKVNKTQVIKSISTKKNTESADTATANFDTTESVEKELSDIMDCVETKKDKSNVSLKSAKAKSDKGSTQSKNLNASIADEMELINDLDIFNSGSVKELNVRSLQNTDKAYSEIMVPTMTNKTKKSQKVRDKRDREANEELDIPKNKKQKVDDLNRIEEKKSKNVGNDSEPMNYDAIMSQVFANIDADIKGKTQSSKANSNKIVDKDEEINSKEKPKSVNSLKNTEKDVQQKYSENIFSLVDKDSEVIDITNNSLKQVEPDSTQKRIENLLTPGMCHDLVSSTREVTQKQEVEPMDVQMGTPLVDSDDSDKSVVEETPQKNVSFTKHKQKSDSSNKEMDIIKEKPLVENKDSEENNNDSQIIRSIINITDTEESGKLKDVTVVNMPNKNSLETPLTINKFVGHIKHNSTPVARKSLNFDSENMEDLEQTLCPTTTQEKEFMAKAFEQTPNSPARRPLGLNNMKTKEIKKLCLAGSCLTARETANLKLLCLNNGWTYVDKYTKDITHLVVGVDKENKSQRSVKYMCALAASKWIVSYDWVEKCLISKKVVEELPFEALDACGEPGPKMSRLAPRMLFEGISFYCMSPFSILDVETLKYILEEAGGRVVNKVQDVQVTAGSGPALLLAEPEHTQEDRFIYLAMEMSIVPVNYEWVLNCLGSFCLGGLNDLLLCPSALLPPATRDWPAALMYRDSQEDL